MFPTPNSFHSLVNTFHVSQLKASNPNFSSTEYPVFIHPRMLWKERVEHYTHLMAIVPGSVKTHGLIFKLCRKRQNPKLPRVCIKKHTLCPLSKITYFDSKMYRQAHNYLKHLPHSQLSGLTSQNIVLELPESSYKRQERARIQL